MAKKDYDKTLTRLIGILTKLSNYEYPTTKELAQEYNVTLRTIQKDIKEHLCYFPIIRRSDYKYMFTDGFSMKQTSLTNDEMIFLNLALSQFNDVDDIDKIKASIYKKIINKKLYTPYYIKQDDLEDIDIDSPFISQLESFIQEREIVNITFTNVTKTLELYKIAAFDGFWYLFAKDLEDNRVKTFYLSHIKKMTSLGTYHKTSNQMIEDVLNRVHSAFFTDGNSFKVLIKVYPKVSQYFKSRDFLTSQEIVKENEDGSLLVRFEVTHDEDIDNIIKSWLPDIEVLEPKRYKEKILQELQEYIKKIS